MEYGCLKQHTIEREVWCEGVGLHSGLKVSMKLKPAPPDHGVRFRRMDIFGGPTVIARHHHVVDTFQATTIGFDGVVVATVEHVMAAFFGCGLDNILIELDGPEVPIFDGSAAPLVKAIQRAGVRAQGAVKRFLAVENPIVVREGDAFIKASPSDRFRIRCAIEYPHPLVGRQELTWSFNRSAFGREIAGARTFGFLKDVQKLQSMGRAKGGSLENAVIFDDFGLVNHDGFRYADECVRHKILDFMGDLALTGMSVVGHFEVHKAGHSLHSRFLKALLKNSESRAASMPVRSSKQALPAAAIAAPYAEGFTCMSKPLG